MFNPYMETLEQGPQGPQPFVQIKKSVLINRKRARARKRKKFGGRTWKARHGRRRW